MACSPTLFFYFNLKTNLFFTTFILLDFVFLISVLDDLNVTSLQLQPRPFNRTIQSFVKDYVDEYVGLYNLTVLFVLILKATFHFCRLYLTHWNMDSSLLIFISDGLNLSSSQPQPPDNRTIQNFVKDYIDEYGSKYAAERHGCSVCVKH